MCVCVCVCVCVYHNIAVVLAGDSVIPPHPVGVTGKLEMNGVGTQRPEPAVMGTAEEEGK